MNIIVPVVFCGIFLVLFWLTLNLVQPLQPFQRAVVKSKRLKTIADECRALTEQANKAKAKQLVLEFEDFKPEILSRIKEAAAYGRSSCELNYFEERYVYLLKPFLSSRGFKLCKTSYRSYEIRW